MTTTLISDQPLQLTEDLNGAPSGGVPLSLKLDPSVTAVQISGIPSGVTFNHAGSSTGLPAGTLQFSASDAASLTITALPLHSLAGFNLNLTPLANSPSTISVDASGDTAGGAAPLMAFYVDGVQVGSTVSVTASHAANNWETLTFTADISHAHDIEVAFLNDWWNGNGGDRNLYVDHIAFNGHSLASQSATYDLASGGTIAGQTELGWNGSLDWSTSTLPSTWLQNITTGAPTSLPVTIQAPVTTVSTVTNASDYLQTHRFFADSSPWNTVIDQSDSVYSAIPNIASYSGGLTGWLSNHGDVSIYYAQNSDPTSEILFNANTWSEVASGAWLRSGNSSSVEQSILSESSTINPFPGNPYSTTNAALQWNTGGLPATFDQWQQTQPLYVHIPANATPQPDSDGLTVVVEPNGTALEMYSPIKLSSGQWVSSMFSFTDALNGQGVGTEDGRRASMIESYAGALRDIDVTSGHIDHALALVVPPTMLTTAFTSPAAAFDSNPNYSGTLPMGAHLALPANIDLSSLGLKTPFGMELAEAAQQYGMYVVDRGGSGISMVTEHNAQSPVLNVWTSDMSSDFSTIMHHAALVQTL